VADFLWALVDEGIVRRDMGNRIDVNGVNAPDGVVGPYREKEGSFFAIREIFSPVKMLTNALPQDFNGNLLLENRFHFTNLKACRFEWQLVNFTKPFSGQQGFTILQKGRAASPDIDPLQQGNLILGLPANWKQHDALQLIAYDIQGNEMYTWNWKIQNNEQLLKALASTTTDSVSVRDNDTTISLASAGISIAINRADGMLVRAGNVARGPLSFGNGPVLVSGKAKMKDISVLKQGENAVVTVNYDGDLKQATWTMKPGGWVQLDYSYAINGCAAVCRYQF
jgi:hypothetical protein